MKRCTIGILCLALLSLACLQTAEPFVTYPADTPTTAATLPPMDESVAGATFAPMIATLALTPSPSPEGRGGLCAVVIAVEALHVRRGPSEKDIVLTWLDHGDLVRVIDQSEDAWWFIERAGVSGYARSMYLEERECK